MVAAAGQQWYAGRQQEHEAGAQIPVARGIGSVLVANCALKNEKSGAAHADSTRPSGADCGVFSLTGLIAHHSRLIIIIINIINNNHN